jgi:hypothetical protein
LFEQITDHLHEPAEHQPKIVARAKSAGMIIRQAQCKSLSSSNPPKSTAAGTQK